MANTIFISGRVGPRRTIRFKLLLNVCNLEFICKLFLVGIWRLLYFYVSFARWRWSSSNWKPTSVNRWPNRELGITLSQLYRFRYLTVIVSCVATYASRRGIIISIVYGVADYGTGDVTIESHGGGIRGNRQNLHRAEQLHAANARRCKRAATCMRD